MSKTKRTNHSYRKTLQHSRTRTKCIRRRWWWVNKIHSSPKLKLESKEFATEASPELINVAETGWSMFYSPYFGELSTNDPMYEPMMIIELYRKRLLALVQERNSLCLEIKDLKSMVKTLQMQTVSSTSSSLFNSIPLHPNLPTAITMFGKPNVTTNVTTNVTSTDVDPVVHIPSDLLK